MSVNKASRSHGREEALNPLAVWQYFPVSQKLQVTLARLNKMLSTYAGVDRSLMLVQYGSPLVALLIARVSALQRRLKLVSGGPSLISGLSSARVAAIASSLKILSGKASEARMLGRFFGLFPIFAWIFSLEKKETQPKDVVLRNVQRIQAWSMLAYYPLEHAYYLSAQGVINMTAQKRVKAIMWACRAWGVFTFLQLFIQSQQAKQLSNRMESISARRATLGPYPHQQAQLAAGNSREKDQEKVDTDDIVQQAGSAVEEAALVMNERECLEQGKKLMNSVCVNLAYAPMAVHWSLEQGLFTSDIWASVFMSAAAILGLQANWALTK